MRYLLDTNIVSDLVRNPQEKVGLHIRKVGEEQICTSIIVAAELRYGAAKKGSPRLLAQLEAVLGALEVLSFEPRWIPPTDYCVPDLSKLARPSVAMTCLSRPRRLHLLTRL